MSDFWVENETEISESEERIPLDWLHFKKICFHLWRQFDDQYYAGFAGMLAYFFLMSAVPMLITPSGITTLWMNALFWKA